MKEAKFIELLNLYVDQQLEPADAALLETEIARNPARLKVYHDYCRMHRACSVLFEQSRPVSDVGVKLATAAAAADEKMMTFPEPRRSYAWTGYAAGLAAAACVALVFVQKTTQPSSASPREEIVQITPVKESPTNRSGGLVIAPVNYSSAVPIAPNSRRASPPADEPSFDWMRRVTFTPIAQASTSELKFESRSATASDQRVFHSHLPVPNPSSTPKLELMSADDEKAAWQFQR